LNEAVAPVVERLKKRLPQKPKTLINWADDVFVRWHRNALYLIVVMRTPHGQPPTFESRAARIQYAGDNKFAFDLPMRQGWASSPNGESVAEVAKSLEESTFF
jgi:hypothetical protein